MDANRNSCGNRSTNIFTCPTFRPAGLHPTLLLKAAKDNLRGKWVLIFLSKGMAKSAQLMSGLGITMSGSNAIRLVGGVFAILQTLQGCLGPRLERCVAKVCADLCSGT